MNNESTPNLPENDRIHRMEDPGRDFPFYQGLPVRLTGPQWGVILLLVAIAFALLIAPIPWPAGTLGQAIPAILFPAIPLVGVAFLSRGNTRFLFGRVGAREIKLMILFAILNFVVTMIVGGVVKATLGATPNTAIANTSNLATGELVLFFLKTAVQLLGEELLTILPFLALMYVLVSKLHLGRKPAVLWSWVATAILFGLVHLSTYDWNIAQCLLIIGTARLVLSLAYLKTKNLWVSTGAHIINDWVLLAMNIVGTKLLGS